MLSGGPSVLSNIEIHEESVKPGMKVVLVDDLLATGGSLSAAASLVEMAGGEVVKIIALMELVDLKGREVLGKYDFEQVNAIPQPNHAGGALATVAYQKFDDPILVESINGKADAGIDIGGTMIGMHMHSVVVPMRISLRKIGEAPIICARHRPKYVGGQRAIYDESLM